MLLISGVEGTERIGGPFKESIQKRTPWLLINLITAFMASAVVGLFQDTIEQVVVLAVAMPIITGMVEFSFSNISTGYSRSCNWSTNLGKDKSMY